MVAMNGFVLILLGLPLLASAGDHEMGCPAPDAEFETPPVVPHPVYSHWDDEHTQHTFHAGACWLVKGGNHGNEDRDDKDGLVFHAYVEKFDDQLQPVFAWWDTKHKQHTFHMDPAWADEEKAMEQPAFYAYTEPGPELCGVDAFWHEAENQHRFHCVEDGPWPGEEYAGEAVNEAGKGLYYTFKKDFMPKVHKDEAQNWMAEPVHAWFDPINTQHTFHFAPAWSIHDKCEVECAGDRVFWAWRHENAGTQPVYLWWDDVNKQHTFHFEPKWTHGDTEEVKGEVVFYAFPDEASAPEGACAVHAFWDKDNKQHNFHCGEAWKNGETLSENGERLYYVLPKTWNPDTHDDHDHGAGGGGDVMERTIGLGLASDDGSLTDEAKQTFLTDCNNVIKDSAQMHCSCKSASVENEGILEVTFEGPQKCLDELAMKETWDGLDTDAMQIVGDMMEDYTPAAKGQGVPTDQGEAPPADNTTADNTTEASGARTQEIVKGISWASIFVAGFF